MQEPSSPEHTAISSPALPAQTLHSFEQKIQPLLQLIKEYPAYFVELVNCFESSDMRAEYKQSQKQLPLIAQWLNETNLEAEKSKDEKKHSIFYQEMEMLVKLLVSTNALQTCIETDPCAPQLYINRVNIEKHLTQKEQMTHIFQTTKSWLEKLKKQTKLSHNNYLLYISSDLKDIILTHSSFYLSQKNTQVGVDYVDLTMDIIFYASICSPLYFDKLDITKKNSLFSILNNLPTDLNVDDQAVLLNPRLESILKSTLKVTSGNLQAVDQSFLQNIIEKSLPVTELIHYWLDGVALQEDVKKDKPNFSATLNEVVNHYKKESVGMRHTYPGVIHLQQIFTSAIGQSISYSDEGTVRPGGYRLMTSPKLLPEFMRNQTSKFAQNGLALLQAYFLSTEGQEVAKILVDNLDKLELLATNFYKWWESHIHSKRRVKRVCTSIVDDVEQSLAQKHDKMGLEQVVKYLLEAEEELLNPSKSDFIDIVQESESPNYAATQLQQNEVYLGKRFKHLQHIAEKLLCDDSKQLKKLSFSILNEFAHKDITANIPAKLSNRPICISLPQNRTIWLCSIPYKILPNSFKEQTKGLEQLQDATLKNNPVCLTIDSEGANKQDLSYDAKRGIIHVTLKGYCKSWLLDYYASLNQSPMYFPLPSGRFNGVDKEGNKRIYIFRINEEVYLLTRYLLAIKYRAKIWQTVELDKVKKHKRKSNKSKIAQPATPHAPKVLEAYLAYTQNARIESEKFVSKSDCNPNENKAGLSRVSLS